MPFNEFHYTPTGTGVISGKEVLEQTEDAINDLGTQISGDVQTAIDTANNALNTANTASADAQNAVNTANTAYTTATNAQNTANNALTAAQNAQNDVNALGNRVTTAEGNITQNTTDITNLTTRMGTAEGNITTLQNDVVTAQGTATSAQNTATMARQQAYVLRYSSTAITDNSTIAYSTLDNTDNSKSSDKIIDSDGKIFSVVSVDSANETVTVGSALIDLALDANVMHLSGNETAAGIKDFADMLRIYNSLVSGNVAELSLINQKVLRGSTSDVGEQIIQFYDKSLSRLARISVNVSSNGATQLSFYLYNSDSNNQLISSYLSFLKYKNGDCILIPYPSNNVSLGSSNYKFKDLYTNAINGLNPGALGLPQDRSARLDISSYFTNTGNGDSNTYTVPANGWIYLNLNTVNNVNLISQTSGGLTNYADNRSRNNDGVLFCLFPVRNGDVFRAQWYTGSSVTVSYAYFLPCLGNA